VLKGDVRVVVLNACYSAAQARGIVQSIDCAVGIKGEIGDEASIAFSAEFYQALAYGRSVQQAFDLGVARLCSEGIAAPAARVKLDRREGVDPSQIILAGIQNAPPLGDAYFHRAQGYIGTEHYEEAIRELNHAIRLDPNSPRYFHYRGRGYLGLGHYKQCKNDFARAHALDPMNFPIPRVVFTVRFRVFLLMQYLFDPWLRRLESP
jgi:tetratricopeptide (TPR) repeat protein